MNKTILSICLCTALCYTGVDAVAQQTQKFTAAKHNDYGLTYSLPTTHVNITLNGVQTTRTAGVYYQYAKKYLGVDNATSEDSKQITITGADIATYGVPDAANQYLMQFKAGTSPYILLNERGLLLGVNIPEDTTTPTTVVDTTKKPAEGSENGAVASSAIPGEMLVSESTAKKAELAAQSIYRIRESRTAYITGDADQMPPDGAALKLTLEQLDQQEAALTALFLGTTTTTPVSYTYEFTPGDEMSDKIAFRISDYSGLVDKNDLSGAPVYLTLKVTQRGKIPLNEKGEEKRLPKGAVMYNIPGEAQVTLTYEGKTILDKPIQVAQYGIQYGLPPEMFTDKKAPAYVKFYPETGAVKELGTLEK